MFSHFYVGALKRIFYIMKDDSSPVRHPLNAKLIFPEVLWSFGDVAKVRGESELYCHFQIDYLH